MNSVCVIQCAGVKTIPEGGPTHAEELREVRGRVSSSRPPLAAYIDEGWDGILAPKPLVGTGFTSWPSGLKKGCHAKHFPQHNGRVSCHICFW
jgi:hypothetical protein